MIGLDASILVRYFAKDDPIQTPKRRNQNEAERFWLGVGPQTVQVVRQGPTTTPESFCLRL